MRVLRKIGYDYNGWYLGEMVRCKDDGKEYAIIGFDESGDGSFIAINRAYTSYSIEKSGNVTSYIKTNDTYFEWMGEHEIEKIKGGDKMKKDVLILEYQEVFDDMVAVRIVYQNENILKRYNFSDESLGVSSVCNPSFQLGKLYIRGNYRCDDDRIFAVSKKEAEIIKEKVRQINEKYGIETNWRAEYGCIYYYIETTLEVKCTKEDNYNADNKRYTAGNYFKTKEQAEEAVEKFREILKEAK